MARIFACFLNIHNIAYPGHHLDAMYGLPDVSFILLDKADFLPSGQPQDGRDVSERYIAKSNPWIIMVSTPNALDGLFEKIEWELEKICLYKRLFIDYMYGLNRIYRPITIINITSGVIEIYETQRQQSFNISRRGFAWCI